MQNHRQTPETDAQRQLAWSRSYLKREKRMRLLRRVIPILLLAGVFAMGVYAATGGTLPAWPTAGTTPPDDAASLPAAASTAAPPEVIDIPAPQTQFTVTFDSRGGTDVAAQTQVARGALLAVPAAPTREGYLFSGWYADETRTRLWDFNADTVEQDLTLYAGWEPAQTSEPMPQTGVESGAVFWLCVLAAALALAGGVTLLLRSAYRR